MAALVHDAQIVYPYKACCQYLFLRIFVAKRRECMATCVKPKRFATPPVVGGAIGFWFLIVSEFYTRVSEDLWERGFMGSRYSSLILSPPLGPQNTTHVPKSLVKFSNWCTTLAATKRQSPALNE
jgi:hypothetical protein